MKLPKAFLNQLNNILSIQELQEYQQALEEKPVKTVRLNPHKLPLAPLLNPIPWAKKGFYLEQVNPSFVFDPSWHSGAYYVQEASSMILEQVYQQLEWPVNVRLLDLSAAPGGKSTHLLSLLKPGDWLVCNEIDGRRCNILAENISKWGVPNVSVTQNMSSDFGKLLAGHFDIILVDAPCSGEGMFRKDNQALDHWSPELITKCEIRQHEILDDVWPALKEGGYLIYSTCTINQKENEEVINNLIQGGEAINIAFDFPQEWNVKCADSIAVYRMIPGMVNGEGFTFAVLQKTTSQSVKKIKGNPKKKDGVGSLESYSTLDWPITRTGNQVYQIHPQHVAFCHYLEQHFEVKWQGLPVGEDLKNKLIPAPQLALSIYRGVKFPSLLLNRTETLHYLRNETFPLEAAEGIHGISYNQFHLGWIKKINQRFNNYYPSQWRIRLTLPKTLPNLPFEED